MTGLGPGSDVLPLKAGTRHTNKRVLAPRGKRYKLIAAGVGVAIALSDSDRRGCKLGIKGDEHRMKLLHFDDFKLGVLKGDAVVDVSAEVKDIPHTGPGDLMNGLIEHWGSYKPRLEAAVARGAGLPVSGVRIRPPVPSPRTIDCMAVNYMEDGTRSAPAPINAFHKSPSAIIGHGDTMVLPDAPATIFEGEAEMAVVIGRKCSHVSEAEAMSYIFGYMNFIDGSARACRRRATCSSR